MASKAKVYFFFDNVSITLRNRTKIKKLIERLFIEEGKHLARLNYIFCTDQALLEINRKYLSHSYYTDIITFDLSETTSQVIGEIYISADRIRDNAKKHNALVRTELHRVIFHGALHLCGYNDNNKRQRQEMRKMEDIYLKKLL